MNLGSCELGRVFLAPLSGVADSPFRRICKTFGADTVYSEMVSAQGLTRGSRRTAEVFRFDQSEHPIGVQLFGSDPQRMAGAAFIVAASRPDFIDLNFSCPARKIVTRGAGCALMRDPVKTAQIARAVVAAIGLPVTAKIRLGWDDNALNAAELAGRLEDVGVKAVAVHGRTCRQGFRGAASWAGVAEVKRAVGIPVILSGDVFTPDDAVRAFDETGCDAIMVARGVYGRPWVFRAIQSRLAGGGEDEPTGEEKREVVLRHLDLEIEQYGERTGTIRFRKHLLWYTKGVYGVVAWRQAMSHVETRQEIAEILSRLDLA